MRGRHDDLLRRPERSRTAGPGWRRPGPVRPRDQQRPCDMTADHRRRHEPFRQMTSIVLGRCPGHARSVAAGRPTAVSGRRGADSGIARPAPPAQSRSRQNPRSSRSGRFSGTPTVRYGLFRMPATRARSMLVVAEFVAVTVWPVAARQQRRVATLASQVPVPHHSDDGNASCLRHESACRLSSSLS